MPWRFGTLTYFVQAHDKSCVAISLTPYEEDEAFLNQEKYLKTFEIILATLNSQINLFTLPLPGNL